MRRVAFAILSTIAGLVGLLTFKTESLGSTVSSAAVSTTHAGTTTPNSGTTSSTPTTKASTPSAAKKSTKKLTTRTKSSTPTAASSTAAAPKTVSGSVIDTQYGPVQVQITVSAGKVTAATAVQYPNGDPRSQQINAYAVPILQKETVGISSASRVDMVSGATYTSNGYLQSLQSALDQAGR